jgi:NAD(P)-dependent dehydrogenase (short-subunit alcohol dehydrogenase family)
MMSRLEGKVAIVTGGGAGQGAEEVRVLAALGAKVVATDLDAGAVQAVVASVNRESPGGALALPHDVASREDWSRVVAEAVRAFGPVSVLVNNAGILNRVPYEALTLELWQATMNVNAWGVFAGIQAVAPAMREAGGGSIINIASTAAVAAVGGLSAYTASKGAVDALTRAAAIELAPNNIRVNCIHPGIIQTAMVEQSLSTDAALAAAASAIPLGRLGRPVDVAYLVAYLASDEAWFTTGASLVIDGGATIEGGGARLKERVMATRT